jgi:hypothetical protein
VLEAAVGVVLFVPRDLREEGREGGREGGRACHVGRHVRRAGRRKGTNLELGLDAVSHPNAGPTVGSQVDAGKAMGPGVARREGEDRVLSGPEGAGLDGDILREGGREEGRRWERRSEA